MTQEAKVTRLINKVGINRRSKTGKVVAPGIQIMAPVAIFYGPKGVLFDDIVLNHSLVKSSRRVGFDVGGVSLSNPKDSAMHAMPGMSLLNDLRATGR